VSMAEILKTYLVMNISLFVAFIIFTSFRKLLRQENSIIKYRQWIRYGQIVIILSFFVPALLHVLPKQHLPELRWGNSNFISDSMGGARVSSKPNISFNEAGTQSALNRDPDFYSEISDWVQSNLSQTSLILCVFFGLGVAGMLARLFFNAFKLFRMLRRSHLIRNLGQIQIALSDETLVPFSVRLLRKSWVVLPQSLILNGPDFKIALKHELQHHRQGDTSWAILIEMFVCFFFLNPAIYFWKRDLTELQEFSCDEALIGQRGVSSYDYGSCLLRVAETALGSREMYVGTTYMALISKNPKYYKSFLRRRIEMFTSHERPRMKHWAGALIGTLAATLTLAVAFGAQQSMNGKSTNEVNSGEVVVDPEIQAIAEKVLREEIRTQEAKAGFAIVADPTTGRILAIANIDTTGNKKGYWALSQALEPASQMKALVAAQAIESGLTTPESKHKCENGKYQFGNRIYHDWKRTGWESLTTEETIMLSSNICAMKIAEQIGDQGLVNILVDFGFGPEGSGKSFPAAKTGTLPPNEDPKDPKLVPYVSGGFGFLITPLELLQAYGAIANGGKLMKPQLANAVDSKGEVVRRVLSEESTKKMKQILRRVVTEGTGTPADSSRYTTAGKTATSYVADLPESILAKGRKKGNFAAFIGFAPLNDPKLEVYVGILDPQTDKKGGAHGGENAAPVFKRIIEDVLAHMNVPPDRIQN